MLLLDGMDIFMQIFKNKITHRKKMVSLNDFAIFNPDIQKENGFLFLDNFDNMICKNPEKYGQFRADEDFLNDFKKLLLLNKTSILSLYNENRTLFADIENIQSFLNLKVYKSEKKSGSIITFNLERNNNKYDIFGLGLKFSPFKRHGVYDNYNTDNAFHADFVDNLYSTSNIFYLYPEKPENDTTTFLFIVDYPGFIRYDFGKSDKNLAKIYIDGDLFRFAIFTFKDFASSVSFLYKIQDSFYLPPFNAFGYTHSRWGIGSSENLQAIIDNHRKDNIKLTNICLDIDVMVKSKNFTVSDSFGGFDGLRALSSRLNENFMYLVPIIDAGIKVEDGYQPYEIIKKNDAFVKSSSGNDFIGKVWPGDCSFPDFLNEDGLESWKNLTKQWITDSQTSDLWIDMNEPSIFDQKNRTFPDSVRFNRLKFKNRDVHNIYPYFQAKTTLDAYLENDIRPMFFSRSGYTFNGRFCGNWTGDNQPRIKHLLRGWQQVLSLSLSGNTYSGTDIGGFWYSTSEKLLQKWFIMAFFHPLFRNHSSIFSKKREIYLLREPVKSNIRSIINVRYMLLPSIYSLFMLCMRFKKPYILPFITTDNHIIDLIADIAGCILYSPFDNPVFKSDRFIKKSKKIAIKAEDERIDSKDKEELEALIDKKTYKKLSINNIFFYLKSGKAIFIDEKEQHSGSMLDYSCLKVLTNPDDNGNFETFIYIDDGRSARSLQNYAIFKIYGKYKKCNDGFIEDSLTYNIETLHNTLNETENIKATGILQNLTFSLY
jgi:alpha-glucosidase